VISGSEDALTTVRAYHDAWWREDFDAAGDHLAPDLAVEVPINGYDGKADFLEAVRRTRARASNLHIFTALGDRHDAVLVYDMTLPIGDLRIAEAFVVDNQRIVRIRQIHDTVALRAAGFERAR
jgi:limonene-1,2-epoxide hydrolase